MCFAAFSGQSEGDSVTGKRKGSVAIAFLFAVASVYAQTTDFSLLVQWAMPQSVQDAIDEGADIEARGQGGYTPLMLAAKFNHNPEVIATLLKAGAKVDETDSCFGRTALMVAILDDHTNPAELIMVLLNAGADARVKDKKGMTTFDYAEENQKLKGTEALQRLEEASKYARSDRLPRSASEVRQALCGSCHCPPPVAGRV